MKYFIFLLLVIIAVNTEAQKAAVNIIDKVFIELSALADSITITQLDDGGNTPKGYKLVARGRWKAGPATFRCSESTFMDLTRKKAREIGATHIKIYERRGPIPLVTTCPGGKILFLIPE